MAHIHLKIQQDQNTKWYILSNAEYLGEAWLAEVYENDTTRIVKQFQCSKFQNCFRELHQVVRKIGKVTQVSGNDVNDSDLTLLKNILMKNSDNILPANLPRPSNFLNHDFFWNWIKNDFRLSI